MPDNKPSTPANDWPKLEASFAAIKEKVFSYAGKAGHNPFLWWNQNGAALEVELGRKTDAKYAEIAAFQFAPPTVESLKDA